MKIRDLYKKYYIMPQLEKHMLRVAGVGKLVAENWKGGCDIKLTTDLCLVHDIGNIVKFDLEKTNIEKFGKIEDLPHWQKIQQKYWDKYGHDAHDATVEILREAGFPQFEPYIVEEESLYFAEAREDVLNKANIASIILMYSDCRVAPKGVVSYRERIDDLKARYGGVGTPTWYDWTFWFEQWIQRQVTIDLKQITESTVIPMFDELLTSTL